MGAHTNRGDVRPRDIRLVLDSIRRIVRALRLFDREAERLAGLSGAQLFVLQNLRAASRSQPGVSVNELAERTHTDQSSVSVIVEKLARANLVRRERSKRDARSTELSLTAHGRTLLRKAPGAAQERMIEALKRFPDGRRRELAGLLSELIGKMGIDADQPTLFFEERNGRRRRAPAQKGSR